MSDQRIAELEKELQEAKRMKDLLLRDSVEDDGAIREIAKTFGLDVDGDSYFVPSPIDLVDQIAGIAKDTQVENRRLCEALRGMLDRFGASSDGVIFSANAALLGMDAKDGKMAPLTSFTASEREAFIQQEKD